MLRAIRAWIGRPNSGIWFSVATVMECRQSVIVAKGLSVRQHHQSR